MAGGPGGSGTGAVASRVTHARHEDLVVEQQEARGDGNRKQGAQDAEKGATGEGRNDGHRAGNGHGAGHDLGGDDVVLKLLINEVVDADDQGRERAVEERDELTELLWYAAALALIVATVICPIA